MSIFTNTILPMYRSLAQVARPAARNQAAADHLIGVFEKLQKKVAEKHGYTLVDHKLELYGIKKKS